jgi:amino acid adenylation domain-containing protein
MTLCAAFNVLLARYSGQDDICIGTPIANRNRADIEDLIGFFVNTLVLRTRVDLKRGFRDLLQQVRQHTLDAYAHQDAPFEQLVEALQPERSASYTPLFQVMLVLQNAPIGKLELPGLSMQLLDGESSMAKFDLMLTLTESEDGLQGNFEYSTELFEQSTIERMAGHFIRLLQAIVADSDRPVGGLSILDEAERHRLLHAFNDTGTEHPDVAPNLQTLHQLFEAQVERTPDRIAVVCEGESLSYAELNAQANRLARHLRQLGAGPDVLVGLCVERSVAMIVGLYGILKADAAYVPLDPGHPADRLMTIVADAKPAVILTQRHLRDALLATPDLPVFCLDSDAEVLSGYCDGNLDHHAQPNHLAYVIYTSGSTGRPKGVMVEHHSVLNLWSSLERAAFAEGGQGTSVGLNASVTFDASLQSLTQLLSGRTLVIFPQALRTESAALLAYIRQQRLAAFDCTPMQLEMLLDAGLLMPSDGEMALKTVLVGGEALSPPLWERLRQASEVDFYNVYGPTECTVDATICALRNAGDRPSLGGPLGGVRMYILDERREPVPIGVTGEIYIGGDGVARGYLNRPELTAERFLSDPFHADPGARMYSTGDLGRWLEDGNIEYLGRNDFQVKIRGFRIELGEIEAKLAAYAEVRQAVVMAREDEPGDKRLVAYLLTEPESGLSGDELRIRLASQLPDYMLPSAFVVVDAFPLTPNGKVDRRALPLPGRTQSGAAYVAPRTPTEQILANVWIDILKVERVGVLDDFFRLGGHSLMAIQLVSQLRKRAGIELELRDLFAHPTLDALAACVDASRHAPRHPNLVPIRTQGHRTPLFLVHPIGGEVQYAFDLARHMDAEQPVYALAASGMAVGETPNARIGDMARVYLEAVRQVQPRGPYLLGGWSLGGMVAYEMAHQLIAAGESIKFVGMIDAGSSPYLRSQLRNAGGNGFDECRALMHWIADLHPEGIDLQRQAVFTELETLATRKDMDAMVALSQRESFLPAQLDMALVKRVLAVYCAGMTAAAAYEAPLIATAVTYFAADRGDGEYASFGWSELLGDVLEVTRIGGNHMSIVKPPHIEKLAQEIRRRLGHRSPSTELSSI